MRMLMTVKIPNEQFNAAVTNGSAGKIISRILEECNPETVYFTEEDGCRGAILAVEVVKASDIPRLAEPWFLSFNASVHFHIAMTPEELRKAALDDLGRKWG